MLATNSQKAIIHVAKGQLGLDDDTYRGILWDYGVESAKDLTKTQATLLIEDFVKKGFVTTCNNRQAPRKKRPRGENLVHLANADELAKINAVAALITWEYEDGLQRFLARRLRLKNGKVKTSQEAYLAIEAVKKLFENGMKKAHGDKWWSMEFTQPEVMEYIRRHCPEEYR